MEQNATTPLKDNIALEEKVESKDILRILENRNNDRGGLISILEQIQAEYGYLPEEALRIVSRETGRSLVDIYGVATFYRFFSLKPKGKHLVCACLGTACHVRGAARIVGEIEHQLSIKAGQTTDDKEFTLETVNCMGACALGPVVAIDGHYFSKVRKSKVKQLLDQAREGFDAIDVTSDERIFPVSVNCPQCNRSFADDTVAVDGYPGLKINVTVDGQQGWVALSCLYGSYNVSTEFEIAEGSIVDFECPHCKSQIVGMSDCSQCGAPMIAMPVDGGGIVRICSRRGCRNHLLDLG